MNKQLKIEFEVSTNNKVIFMMKFKQKINGMLDGLKNQDNKEFQDMVLPYVTNTVHKFFNFPFSELDLGHGFGVFHLSNDIGLYAMGYPAGLSPHHCLNELVNVLDEYQNRICTMFNY